MPRAIGCLVVLAVFGTTLLPAAVQAASRPGVAAPVPLAHATRPAMLRHATGPSRHWGGHGRGRDVRRFGSGAPWYAPFPDEIAGPEQLVLLPYPAPRAVDGPRGFSALPARAGIPRPPTPDPTIYRIEGPRDRPVARVIRLSELEPAGAARSRHVHGETGALLLTVPGR